MSRKKNPYIFYTEYYLVSGAYQVINVVNEILTYSASYSDNIKEYLRNQVASKQVALNEISRNESENNNRINASQNDNDVDEDGFIVIKMRKPKVKNTSNPTCTFNANASSESSSESSGYGNTDPIVKEVIERLINDVIKKYIDLDDRDKQ